MDEQYRGYTITVYQADMFTGFAADVKDADNSFDGRLTGYPTQEAVLAAAKKMIDEREERVDGKGLVTP